ncbi:MAG: hypothetical protein AB7D57_06695 [Desulfovibrionaceae bacterium]
MVRQHEVIERAIAALREVEALPQPGPGLRAAAVCSAVRLAALKARTPEFGHVCMRPDPGYRSPEGHIGRGCME